MQVHSRGDRQLRLRGELSQEACYQPGEMVSCAAGSHGGRAGRVNPNSAVGKRDYGAFTFEDQGYPLLRSERAGLGYTIGYWSADKTRHLSGMWRQDS